MLFCSYAKAQDDISSEDELKKKANELFEMDEFAEAKPLFAQLLSLYPKDPNYNYKYGACLLESSSDKEEPLKYLQFAITKRGSVDDLAQYYLGRAYHLNYYFAKAVKAYSRFKRNASSENMKKYMVDRQIEMCKNGNQLLSKLNDVQVLDRQVINSDNFFRIYDLEGIDGKIITKPADFRSKYDEKINERSVIYLPNDAKEVYYSSFGKKGENGKDIYKSVKLGNGEWSEGVALGSGVNTPYDEDYPFIHPDGRTLFFASKGHSSMGGYDLFKSTFDQQTNSWKAPENMDFAFSSADDDILFITDENQVLAYFASNRANESGQITVYKVLVEKAPAAVTVIKGKFVAENNPELKTAKITVIDPVSNETVGVFNTDENGKYNIEINEKGGTYKFLVETTDDAPIHTSSITIPDQDEFEVLGQELRLVEQDGQETLVIKNIFDGTTAANSKGTGPQVSAQLLREKAKLEVNYDPQKLASLLANGNARGVSNDVQGNSSQNNVENTASINKDNEAIENTESSGIDESALAAIRERLVDLKNEWNAIDDQENSSDIAFNTSLELKKEADDHFAQHEQLKSANSDSTEIAEKLLEAKETALAAAYAARLGNAIDKVEKNRNQAKTDVQKTIDEIEDALSNNQSELADALLSKVENKSTVSPQKSVFFKQRRNEVAESFISKNTALMDLIDKEAAFKAEKEQLIEQLDVIGEQLKSASGQKRVELQTQEEELQLDLKDLEYRLQRNEEAIEESNEEVADLGIEKSVYDKISTKIQNKTTSEQYSDDRKAQILSDLKSYEDKGLIAYSEVKGLPEDLNSSTVDNDEIVQEPSNASIDPEVATREEINTHFENQLESIANIGDADVQDAQRIQLYDQWIDGLQQKLVQKENGITQAQTNEERTQLQEEMDLLLEEINEKQGVRDDLNNEFAQQSGITQNQVDKENSSKNTNVKSSLDKSIAQPVDISEVDQFSVIDDSFSKFTFDQTYDVGNQTDSPDLLNAKRSLFQASGISAQAEEARQAAYNLPTIGERQNAFDRANELERLSEAKQLEAAEYFRNYNETEYQLNVDRLNNAKEYDEEFESNNLDIANLLAEEAEVYFQNAAEIRAAIDPNDRLSRKQTDIQKAYDFEMLALNKQREALKVLKIVDDEYVNRATLAQNVSNSSAATSQFESQQINDAEVMAVTNPESAKQQGDALQAELTELRAAIQVQSETAEGLEVGPQRDSVIASVELMKQQLSEKETKASNFYLREQQLKEAKVIEEARQAQMVSNITKPRKVVDAQVIELDTVNVSEEQERLLIESAAFSVYAKSDQQNKQLLKEAETEYLQAVELTKEKIQLEKQAKNQRTQAENTQDEAEKERLIKSAEVIELNAQRTRSKIDSIETIVKIKNYLISANETKKKNALTNIPQEEKQALLITYSKYENDPILAEWVDLTPSDSLIAGEDILSSQESSETIEQLQSLEGDQTEIGEVPLSESAIEDERTDDGVSELKFNESPEGEDTGIRGTGEDYPNVNSSESTITTDGQRQIENNTTERNLNEGQLQTDNNSRTEPNEIKPSASELPALTLEKIDKIPTVVDRPIFLRLDRNQSAYSDARPIPVNTPMPEGLIYKVQIGAFRNPIPQDLFKGFAPLMAEQTNSGITRYTAGFFLSEGVAVRARDEIRAKGYPDAFVVAFLNGERISISQARNSGGGDSSPEEIEAFQTNAAPPKSEINSVPKLTKVAGGSQDGLKEAFRIAGSQAVVNTETIEGLIFTVQVGVYSKVLPSGTFEYQDMHVVQLSNGLFRYNTGKYSSAIAAAEVKINIQPNIKDAFVVAYYNGERISLNEAANIKNNK